MSGMYACTWVFLSTLRFRSDISIHSPQTPQMRSQTAIGHLNEFRMSERMYLSRVKVERTSAIAYEPRSCVQAYCVCVFAYVK
jgi:hypothetical protein